MHSWFTQGQEISDLLPLLSHTTRSNTMHTTYDPDIAAKNASVLDAIRNPTIKVKHWSEEDEQARREANAIVRAEGAINFLLSDEWCRIKDPNATAPLGATAAGRFPKVKNLRERIMAALR